MESFPSNWNAYQVLKSKPNNVLNNLRQKVYDEICGSTLTDIIINLSATEYQYADTIIAELTDKLFIVSKFHKISRDDNDLYYLKVSCNIF